MNSVVSYVESHKTAFKKDENKIVKYIISLKPGMEKQNAINLAKVVIRRVYGNNE